MFYVPSTNLIEITGGHQCQSALAHTKAALFSVRVLEKFVRLIRVICLVCTDWSRRLRDLTPLPQCTDVHLPRTISRITPKAFF